MYSTADCSCNLVLQWPRPQHSRGVFDADEDDASSAVFLIGVGAVVTIRQWRTVACTNPVEDAYRFSRLALIDATSMMLPRFNVFCACVRAKAR